MEEFWEGFRAFLASLGPLLASFFGACILNALRKGSWRLLGWILAPFWRVWEGSGEGFGRDLGEFGGFKIVGFLDCIFGFRVLVVGAFGGVSQSDALPFTALATAGRGLEALGVSWATF